jgi:two-component system cell cycle sensor histidine kinase/response regulator CckA
MKPAFRLRGWLRRLPWDIILVYLVFNAMVGLFASFSLERLHRDMRNRNFDDLNSIAELKSSQISAWLEALQLAAPRMTHDEIFAAGSPSSPGFNRSFELYARQIDPQRRFAAAALMSPAGSLLASVPRELPLPPRALAGQVLPLLGMPWPRLSDLFLGPGGRVFLVMVHSLPRVGALAFLVDARRELFPLLREWPTSSRSAETLLVRQEGDRALFLNDLRFQQGAALSLTAPRDDLRRPAAQAVRRRNGVMEGLDYRERRVLAAWRTVPGTTWSIVAKVDIAEVDRPLRELTLYYLLMTIVLGLASTLFLVLRLRQLVRHSLAEREALVSHYGYLARYANDIILLLDAMGNIIEANDRAAELYGYGRAGLLSLDYRQLSGEPANPKPLNPGEGLVVESIHRRKDGTTFPVEASIRSIRVGSQLYTQCILRDISERKKAEEEKLRLEKQLQQVRRQEAIGQLAGGVAHDLNNALTAIQGYGELLKRKLPPGASESGPVGGILKAVARATRITDALLAYSEQRRLAWKPVQLNALLSSSRATLQRILGPEIELDLKPHDGPLVLHGDGGLLLQVLSHLAENARRAMPQGGCFTVALEAAPPQDNADWTCLRVRDTGTGMAEGVQERLFEPFFTTQGFGKGAGLGLPMIFGIVRQHGGRIAVQSEPGKGTELRIFLPLAQAASGV